MFLHLRFMKIHKSKSNKDMSNDMCASLGQQCRCCELQFPQSTQPNSSAVTVSLGQAEAQVWFSIFLLNTWPSKEQLRMRMYHRRSSRKPGSEDHDSQSGRLQLAMHCISTATGCLLYRVLAKNTDVTTKTVLLYILT